MEWPLEEITNSCKKVLVEGKNGTKERLIMAEVVRYLTARCKVCANEEKSQVPSSSGDAGDAASSESKRQVMSSSLQQFASSEDAINQLSYACRIAIVGDSFDANDGSRGVSGGGGSIARGSAKALTAALELAALLLDCGIVPNEFVSSPPAYQFSHEASSGAQVFFSKLLGSSTMANTARLAVNSSECDEKMSGGAASTPGIQAGGDNVRLTLVDAVLAARDMVWTRESSDTLCFAFISALSAAAVPRVSRAAAADVNAPRVQTNCLSLHGTRLVRVMEILFAVLSLRNNISSLLHDESRTAINRVSKALPKFVEEEKYYVAQQQSSSSLSPQAPSSSSGNAAAVTTKEVGLTCSTMRGAEDVVKVMELCSSIARNAPLLSAAPLTGSGPSSGSPVESVSATNAGSHEPHALALHENFPALQLSLSLLLQLGVNSGPTLRMSPSVAQCIKQTMIAAVIRTALSTEIDVFRLSLNVLLTYCFRFAGHLVDETSTIFKHVYFRVIDSTYTTLTQKTLVIEVFRHYIEEPQHLIGLFLNYDCNTYSQSIYEEMIGYLGALAGPPEVPSLTGRPLNTTSEDQSTAKTWARNGVDSDDPALAASLAELSAAGVATGSSSVTLAYKVPERLQRDALLTLLLVTESNIQWIERFETDQGDEAAAAAAAAASYSDAARSSGNHNANGPTSVAEADDEVDGPTADESILDSQRQASTVAVGGGEGGGRASNSSSNSNDPFKQARLHKDAFKKFLFLFNEKAKPELAITFLRNSVLVPALQEKEESTEESSSLAATVTQWSAVSSAETAVDASTDGTPDAFATPAGAPETDIIATPEDRADARRVAVFLKESEEYIDKMVLGDYFAKCFRKAESRLVFEEWISLHNFAGMALDEALRQFLGGFKLLGEAQVVDKTMELFAAQYCAQNPSVFSSADTAFILSFSICMLNTDAHSVHVKNKMTCEGFISNNRGIDEGNDLDSALLKGIYERITSSEIVLRRSSKLTSLSRTSASATAAAAEKAAQKAAGNRSVLESIPLLRHLAPRARAAAGVTDKVELPDDTLTPSQRYRDDRYRQEELRAALQDLMDALPGSASVSGGLSSSASSSASSSSRGEEQRQQRHVIATSIECALPMWEVTVNVLCRRLVSALVRVFEESEAYVSTVDSTTGTAGQRGGALASSSASSEASKKASGDAAAGRAPPPKSHVQKAVEAYLRETDSGPYFEGLLRGLSNTVQACCSFGNVRHTEILLEQAYQMTELSQAVIIQAKPMPHVSVLCAIPRTRLRLLTVFLNIYTRFGGCFTARAWHAGYAAVSLIDALANGIDGMWRRRFMKLQQQQSTTAASATSEATTAAPLPDLWFGNLREVPRTIERHSVLKRQAILLSLRSIPGSTVDVWLDQLYDVTQYAVETQLQMANGLVQVCRKELQCNRTFSLTKLFDVVAICASTASRLQWRELWTEASAVFIIAAVNRDSDIANSTLDGLRLIALTYQMRGELLNYSFQREMLRPFEAILMSNHDVQIRCRVIDIVAELIDFRAGHLVSGWSVVFSCLSHAAGIPVVGPHAWQVCERVLRLHLESAREYFGNLIFCLTSFASIQGVRAEDAAAAAAAAESVDGEKAIKSSAGSTSYNSPPPPLPSTLLRSSSSARVGGATSAVGTSSSDSVDETIPLTAISYLVACAHWLQYGLEAPPRDVRDPATIVRWAGRFRSAEHEAAAAQRIGKSFLRVPLATEPLTSMNRLEKPQHVLSKTRYHLWMPLLEGLASIVVMHASARVRAHAVCSIWALLKQYGGVFATDVQDALFVGMLRPITKALILQSSPRLGAEAMPSETAEEAVASTSASQSTPVPSPVTAATDRDFGFDRFDYRLLVYVALKSMLLSCMDTPHLLELACESLQFLVTELDYTPELLQSGVVDVLLRACVDFIACVPREAGTNELVSPPTANVSATVATGTGAGAPRSASPNRVSGRQPPLFAGLAHEIQQTGMVDIVRYKRTAGWTELHHTPAAATTTTVLLAPALRVYSLISLVRQTVLSCLAAPCVSTNESTLCDAPLTSAGLLGRHQRAMRLCRSDRETSLRLCRSLRRVMLALAWYYMKTRDVEGLMMLLDATDASAFSEPTGSSSPSPFTSSVSETAYPVEYLLVHPYSWVLLEFVFSGAADGDQTGVSLASINENCKGLIRERYGSFLAAMADARSKCVELQAELFCSARERVAHIDSERYAPYKGQCFTDVFKASRAPLQTGKRFVREEESAGDASTTGVAGSARAWSEWVYLLHVVGLQCVLMLQRRSTFMLVMPRETLFTVCPNLPSSMEEACAHEFFCSCWEELDLHCSKPTEPVMLACMRLLQARTALQPGLVSGGFV